MLSIEPRNEQLMLRQFWKKYPAYKLNALMRKHYEELMDARAFCCKRTVRAQLASSRADTLIWQLKVATSSYMMSSGASPLVAEQAPEKSRYE